MSRWQIIFWGGMLATITVSLALSIKMLIGAEPAVIFAPEAATIIVGIAAMRVVIFACVAALGVAALGVAFLAIIGSIKHDPEPPPRIR